MHSLSSQEGIPAASINIRRIQCVRGVGGTSARLTQWFCAQACAGTAISATLQKKAKAESEEHQEQSSTPLASGTALEKPVVENRSLSTRCCWRQKTRWLLQSLSEKPETYSAVNAEEYLTLYMAKKCVHSKDASLAGTPQDPQFGFLESVEFLFLFAVQTEGASGPLQFPIL